MINLKMNLNLISKTHLTIGSGKNQFLQSADIIQLKRKFNCKERICIPATTFKGLLRSSAVQIAHFIVGDEHYCKSVHTDKLSSCKSCIICNVFGANNKPSKIFCEDFFPTSDGRIDLQYFTQTSIERDSGKSKKGSLFIKEQIPPNISFKSFFEAKKLTQNEELLIMFALNNLKFCSFGNGNGLIDIEINKVEGFSQDNDIILKLLKKMGFND